MKRRGVLALLGLLPAVPLLIKEAITTPPPVRGTLQITGRYSYGTLDGITARDKAFRETFEPARVVTAEECGVDMMAKVNLPDPGFVNFHVGTG